MRSDESTEWSTIAGGSPPSLTPSTALLNRMIRRSPGPRMLTQTEIDLLRQSAKEIAQATREALQNEDNASGG